MYYRPPVPATGPRLHLVYFLYSNASASEAKISFGGDFLSFRVAGHIVLETSEPDSDGTHLPYQPQRKDLSDSPF